MKDDVTLKTEVAAETSAYIYILIKYMPSVKINNIYMFTCAQSAYQVEVKICVA